MAGGVPTVRRVSTEAGTDAELLSKLRAEAQSTCSVGTQL